MAQFGRMIASSASLTPMYSERLIAGVRPDQFARFAKPGGTLITSNHPAFVLGHLSIYPARVMEHLGKPVGAAKVPANYDALFKNGVECVDDADGKHYPPMADITKTFFDGYKTAIAAVAEADDALFSQPNPNEGRMKELFPTLGSMFIFFLTGHPQSHFGQISAWRRMMGLPPA